jgi:ribosomal protein S27AE
LPEEIERAECPHCGVFVQFQMTGSHQINADSEIYVAGFRCPNCGEGTVVLSKAGFWRRYPTRQPKEIPGVPDDVMQAFREAILSLEAGAPRAAACMLRRTVASACTEQRVPDQEKGKRLPMQVRIDRLKNKLLPATYAAAKAAKVLGDAGAHLEAEDRLDEEIDVDLDTETVRRTAAVVRQFLANLYELPEDKGTRHSRRGTPGSDCMIAIPLAAWFAGS